MRTGLLRKILWLLMVCALLCGAQAMAEEGYQDHAELLRDGYLPQKQPMDIVVLRGETFEEFMLAKIEARETVFSIEAYQLTADRLQLAMTDLLDKHPEFTINVPYGQYDPAEVKKILAVCGTKSGRDTDKIKELGLTLEAGETVDVPGIRQLPLTLECKVIYRQDQDPNAINEENTARYYPRNQQFPQGDYHTAYYGQITDAYIIV